MQVDEQLYLVVNYDLQEQMLFKNYQNACEYANKMNTENDNIYIKSYISSLYNINFDQTVLYACFIKYIKNTRMSSDIVYKIETVSCCN
jgi:hypothetical protein